MQAFPGILQHNSNNVLSSTLCDRTKIFLKMHRMSCKNNTVISDLSSATYKS